MSKIKRFFPVIVITLFICSYTANAYIPFLISATRSMITKMVPTKGFKQAPKSITLTYRNYDPYDPFAFGTKGKHKALKISFGTVASLASLISMLSITGRPDTAQTTVGTVCPTWGVSFESTQFSTEQAATNRLFQYGSGVYLNGTVQNLQAYNDQTNDPLTGQVTSSTFGHTYQVIENGTTNVVLATLRTQCSPPIVNIEPEEIFMFDLQSSDPALQAKALQDLEDYAENPLNDISFMEAQTLDTPFIYTMPDGLTHVLDYDVNGNPTVDGQPVNEQAISDINDITKVFSLDANNNILMNGQALGNFARWTDKDGIVHTVTVDSNNCLNEDATVIFCNDPTPSTSLPIDPYQTTSTQTLNPDVVASLEAFRNDYLNNSVSTIAAINNASTVNTQNLQSIKSELVKSNSLYPQLEKDRQNVRDAQHNANKIIDLDKLAQNDVSEKSLVDNKIGQIGNQVGGLLSGVISDVGKPPPITLSYHGKTLLNTDLTAEAAAMGIFPYMQLIMGLAGTLITLRLTLSVIL